MLRLVSLLLLSAIASAARAAPDGLLVAKLGERVASSTEPRALDAIVGSAQKSGRVRVVDLRGPNAGLVEIRTLQLPQVLTLRPKVVALSLGSADVCGSITLRAFARELHVIADLLSRNAQKTVISTLAVPDEDCARSGPGLRHRVEAFNSTLFQTALRNGLLVADDRKTGGRPPTSPDPTLVAELEEALLFSRSAREAPSPRAPRERKEL